MTNITRVGSWFRALLSVLFISAAAVPAAAALPEPATGGKDGGPISVLIIVGEQARHDSVLDAQVAQRMTDAGYLHQTVSFKEPLTAEFVRQFNTVVMVGIHDFAGGRYYKPGGLPLLNTASNVALIQQHVADGGGLVVVPIFAEAGTQVADTYDAALRPFGLRLLPEAVRDDARALAVPADAAPAFAVSKNVIADPLTEGLSSFIYPTNVMRWDDAYATTPLVLDDPAWRPLVRGEPGSQGMRHSGSVGWTAGKSGDAPVLAAVRDAGKGRVAAVGVTGYHLFTYAFADLDTIGENTAGSLRGIVFEKGDGTTTSDWGKLIDRMIRWTAEPSAAAGLGGKPAAWETKLVQRVFPDDQILSTAVIDWNTVKPPHTWHHRSPEPVWWRGLPFYDEAIDPLVVGPQQFNKILIGARSRYSGGKGAVADWAKAAKDAGYAVLVFTERFEDFNPAEWTGFMEACRAASDDQFVCLQGLDIPDSYGNRLLLMGNTNFPDAGMLTPDGKALRQTARLSLGFSQHIAAIHRCGTSKLHHSLYRHFQAVSVFTYGKQADGNFGLIDDGQEAYHWQLYNASNPVPIAVHEIDDPADVATKGTIGFQLVVPSQNARDAARYFRYGMDHFFENPHRYFITEGPMITGWSILNKDIGDAGFRRDQWRAAVGAVSPDGKTPITQAVLYDRGAVARRWLPNAPSFDETIDGTHGYQRYYMLEVTDADGRRAISPHLRTVTRGYFTRCADRQNWFGAAGGYTGIWPSGRHGIWYVAPQVTMADPAATETFGGDNPLASRMSLPFASNAMTYTDYDIDQRYLQKVDYGMDAWTIHNTEANKTYEANVRVSKWHDVETGLTEYNGAAATLTVVRATLKPRVEVTGSDASALLPVIQRVPTHAPYTFVQDGQTVRGQLDGNAAALIDLPAGASIGDLLLLTPLTVNGVGDLGWRSGGKTVPAGTEFEAAYAYVPPTDAWRAALGAAGDTPWKIELSRGQAGQVLGTVRLVAQDYAVEGVIHPGGEVARLPIEVSGLNANWPAALWTPRRLAYANWGLSEPQKIEGVEIGAPLRHLGVHDGVGFSSLETDREEKFFLGNTLTATDPGLVLAFTHWSRDAAGVEVHNPTDQAITAKIASPAAIPDRFRVEADVTVPAGTTIRLNLPERK